MKLLITVIFLFTGTSLMAQVPKTKTTTVRFDNQLIKGQDSKPDLLFSQINKNRPFKKLIRLRSDFNDKLKETAQRIESK